MRKLDTRLDGLILIEPTVHGDDRGFFMETFRANAWSELGIPPEFVQDNQSRSGRGVVRGMHFSVGDGQAKLIRCARGEIWDVVVDIRRGSPTFGSWEGFYLTDRIARQLFIPAGFAHGFCVISDVADVVYKCSTYYSGETERGFSWNDPAVGIAWPTECDLRVSDRDRTAPSLAEVADEIPF